MTFPHLYAFAAGHFASLLGCTRLSGKWGWVWGLLWKLHASGETYRGSKKTT